MPLPDQELVEQRKNDIKVFNNCLVLVETCLSPTLQNV
jgi:hypothetical protein